MPMGNIKSLGNSFLVPSLSSVAAATEGVVLSSPFPSASLPFPADLLSAALSEALDATSLSIDFTCPVDVLPSDAVYFFSVADALSLNSIFPVSEFLVPIVTGLFPLASLYLTISVVYFGGFVCVLVTFVAV